MESPQFHLPSFLVIGAYSRNAGKTGFSRKIIEHMKGEVIALKVTIIKNDHSGCARGSAGCGVCSSLKSDYEISEETDPHRAKDTSSLLAAGAEKVFWLRVKEYAVYEAMKEFLSINKISGPVICESNSIMKYISPSVFILLKAQGEDSRKKTALSVENKADLIIETTAESSNFDFSRLSYSKGHWSISL